MSSTPDTAPDPADAVPNNPGTGAGDGQIAPPDPEHDPANADNPDVEEDDPEAPSS